jgi:hypothetical protein
MVKIIVFHLIYLQKILFSANNPASVYVDQDDVDGVEEMNVMVDVRANNVEVMNTEFEFEGDSSSYF